MIMYYARVDRLTCVDLFAGAGGATEGLKAAGFEVVGAVEVDSEAAATYRVNHAGTRLWQCDIRSLAASKMRRELGLSRGELTLLKACPPCQGFSTLARGPISDEANARNDLVLDVVRFVREFRPRSIVIENVLGLERDARFKVLLASMAKLGYVTAVYRLDAAQVGVPQRRRRLILIAIRGKRALLPEVLEDFLGELAVANPRTAGEALAELEVSLGNADALDRHRQHSTKVLARISAIPVGGNRFDLPEEYQLECHSGLGVRNATASYGRIRVDRPAPTMTTRCATPACGTFIHPVENRGITLREAAAFQTFPIGYQFIGNFGSIERQIGNAVPVRMATVLGIAVTRLLRTAVI